MAYFPDLSPYTYGGGNHPGIVHVGWLDNVHSYEKGTVSSNLVDKLRLLAKNPVELYRGFHICELCSEEVTRVPVCKEDSRYPVSRQDREGNRFFCPKECMSNGEIRISTTNLFNSEVLLTEAHGQPTSVGSESNLIFVKKTTFAAPVMIAHYIEAHGYLPPVEFLKALEEAPI